MLSKVFRCRRVGFQGFTKLCVQVLVALAIEPAADLGQVSHVARDLALEERVVAQDDVLHLHVDIVGLEHH